MSARLDPNGWVVAIGVVCLCTVVMSRQLMALWDNRRLLAANRELTGQLRHRAFHDQLTGLANRAMFTSRVATALATTGATGATGADGADGAGESPAVLFFDLDDFKIVNDSLGHQAGDTLLQAVAGRLAADLGAGELLGRLGGDEFAILVESSADGHAEQVAKRVLTAMVYPIQLADSQVRVDVSVGIAVAGPDAVDAAALLRNADIAMYAAKRAAKGSWRQFDPAMLTDLLLRHRLRAELAHAVERGELVVHYQPIVRLADGRLHGAEALVRWRRPDGSLAQPDTFIPLAEETGLVTEIDRWVLAEACHQAARWAAAGARGADDAPDPADPADPDPTGNPAFALHVNVSARQLDRPDLVDDVRGMLEASGLPPELLTLEITEAGHRHRPPDRGAPARGAQPARGPAGRGRLRHRLLVAGVPAAAAHRRSQDRQDVHGRAARRGPVAVAGPGRDRAGGHPRHADRRRGDRTAGPGPPAARPRLPVRAGLPLRAGHAGRGAGRTAGRRAVIRWPPGTRRSSP
jgi:diguanylate cyclase (GGDEF)-like protein